MSVKRKPVAFGDFRGWIAALKAAGELQEIHAEVDWNIELGIPSCDLSKAREAVERCSSTASKTITRRMAAAAGSSAMVWQTIGVLQ
jgi:hypothetical protein